MTSDAGLSATKVTTCNNDGTSVGMEVLQPLSPMLMEEDLEEEDNNDDKEQPITRAPTDHGSGVVSQDDEIRESLTIQKSRDDEESERIQGEESMLLQVGTAEVADATHNDDDDDDVNQDAHGEESQSTQFVQKEEKSLNPLPPPRLPSRDMSASASMTNEIDNDLLTSREEDMKNNSNNDLLSGEDDTKKSVTEANAAEQPLLATTTSSDLSESAKTTQQSSSGPPTAAAHPPPQIPAPPASEEDEEANNKRDTTTAQNILPVSLSEESVALSLPELGTKTTTESMELDMSSSDFVLSCTKSAPHSEEIVEADAGNTTTNINNNHNNNNTDDAAGGGAGGEQEEWDEMLNEDDIEEEELKAAQSTDNQETAANSSVTEDQTIRTEDAGTDTTSDTEDSISTASEEDDDDDDDPILGNGVNHDDDDDNGDGDGGGGHHHAIMPRQPEILITHVHSSGGVEEEKTEVDEYPIQEEKRDVDLHDILASLPPEPPNVELPHHHHIDHDDYDDDDEAKHSVPPVIENKRAEYVSVTVLKVEATMKHGLEFMMVNRELRVSHIRPTGMFANSPLAAFDKMLRINDLNIETLDPVNASHLLDVLTGSVTVIAQNPGGVADLVESQITKPLPESRTGLYLQDACIDENLHKNRTEVARIASNSLWSPALLHVSDEVLAINGCTDLDQNTGDLLLSTAPRHCVVLARTKLKTQMAIARRPTHQLPPGFNFVRAMEEARRQREELRRKQGCYYNSCERPGACANLFQWLSNLYVITLVLVALSINWQSIKEEASDGSDAVGTILKFAGLFVGGILLGFLVNAPWWFRIVGARFSIAQLVCNVIVVASFILFFLFYDSADLAEDEYRLVIFFTLFFPLIIFVNLPTIFPKMEDGSDGNTICDAPSDDEMSTNSAGSDIV